MNLYNELVNGRGYSVFSIKNIHILKNLRNEFVERIYNDNKINKDISINSSNDSSKHIKF